MCGITGFSWEDRSLIKRITNCISHRGPDAEGYFIDKGVSLGHRRLAIIDLSPKGKQPMFNEDNAIAIVFNGEIYNYKSIKKELAEKGYKFSTNSDTEVIIKGYEEYGDKICSKLDGMFAFAIWDAKKKIFFLARDRVGKKPLYYSIQEGNLIFSSEIKSLLEAGISNKIDKNILIETIMSRFSPGNNTVFSEIKKMPPGCFGVFSNGKISISSYWKIPKLTEDRIPIIEEVDKLLEKSVEKRLVSDVPVGILLSGGLDSSAIVSYMSRKTDKIKTFSVSFPDGLDESKYSRIVSEKFNTDHKEIVLDSETLSYLPKVVWHMDEPISDPAALPTYLLSKQVSKSVKVALSGEGGDEVFGGYDTINRLDLLKKIQNRRSLIKNLSSRALDFLSKFNKYPKKQILNFGAELIRSKTIEESYKKLYYFPFNSHEIKDYTGKETKDLLDRFIKKDLYQTSIDFYFNEWLPNDLLMKVDKMSMAHGLEMRAPFLDKDLISYFFSIPRIYKTNKLLFKRTLSMSLPKKIVQRKKQGFSLPISNWFKKEDFISRISPHIKDLGKRNILKTEKLNFLMNNPSIYRNDHKLWTLLNLELWYKLYVDKIPLKKVNV